jgi:type I restriction enzyme S subunit
MSSPQVFAQATAGATGAAQKTVSLTVLRAIKVPRHSESEQVGIAARLDELGAHIYKLEDLYSARVTALDELKAALLQQVFRGKLSVAGTTDVMDVVS